MLPIFQAPADHKYTLIAVISRFMAISHLGGQKYTVIIADQPLVLVWANHKFETVIFLVGGLHVCLNFFTRIGQHMDIAGLNEELLTEAGVCAA